MHVSEYLTGLLLRVAKRMLRLETAETAEAMMTVAGRMLTPGTAGALAIGNRKGVRDFRAHPFCRTAARSHCIGWQRTAISSL